VNREAELSTPVSEWLRAVMGCSVYAEIAGGYGVIDHVGIRWADEMIVAVEMKTALTWKVLRQAHTAQLITPAVYVAVATKPRKASLDKAAEYGIGVWSGGAAILQPRPVTTIVDRYRQRVLEHCRNRPEGGIGGLPTLKGDGPAIRCRNAIRAYLANHRAASWRDIYRDVPNHYAHYRSLQGAMPSREFLLHEVDLLSLPREVEAA
jgi:hypothetical protein